jgi:hypothetical protein
VIHHAGKSGDQRGASILTVPMNYVVKLTKPDSCRPVREGETQSVIHGPWSLAVDKVVDKLCALVCWDNLLK